MIFARVFIECIFTIILERICACKDLKTPNGHGNCQNEINGKALCYVTQPSSCSDLKSSIAFPGEKYSYEACDEPRK